MKGTIIDHEGKLFILDEWENDWFEPVQRRLAWPTNVRTRDGQFLVGRTVTTWGTGICETAYGHKILLEHGDKTLPAYSETKPIKKPRGHYVYHHGEWVRV